MMSVQIFVSSCEVYELQGMKWNCRMFYDCTRIGHSVASPLVKNLLDSVRYVCLRVEKLESGH